MSADRLLGTVLALLMLAACSQTLPPHAAPAFNTTLTIQDVMLAVVDPAADALWESVSTVTTPQGSEEHRPRSADEWAALRQHAVRLAEAGNLLVLPGRPVAAPGGGLDDAHVPGVLDAAGVQRALNADRAGFDRAAQRLHAAASQALAAIEAHDAERLLVAGDAIDKACESCHLVYWYPNARRPPPPKA